MEIISRETRAGELKTISTLAAKETGRETEEEKRQYLNERKLSGKLGCSLDNDDGDTLSSHEVTRYKRIAARANFLAQDRVDITFATKEATNDGIHQRGFEQNWLVGEVLCPVPTE